MATSKQEQIYNKVVDYYGMADRLIRTVEDSSHKLSQKQFDIVEDLVITIEKYADEITAKYIEFVKNGSSDEIIENTRLALNGIIAKIEECRNQIYMLYDKKDQSN